MNLSKTITSLLLAFLLIFAGCANVENGLEDERERSDNDQADGDSQQDSLNQAAQNLQDAIDSDGVYTEEISYMAPPGEEKIEFRLEFENGIVSDISIEGIDPHSTSLRMQENCEEGLRDLMVGLSIDEVEIPDRVSGSSLTTQAIREKLDELL